MNDGLKQRIIGAAVLLALAVIFVPVIFDKERITPVDRNTQIPIMPPAIAETDAAILISKQAAIAQEELDKSKNSKKYKNTDVKIIHNKISSSENKQAIAAVEKDNIGTANASEKIESRIANTEKTIRDEVKAPDKIFIPDERHPENLNSEAPSLDKDGVAKAWVLQVASYQSVARAEKIRDELINKGYMSFTKLIKTNTGETTRVYVGPSLVKDTLTEAKKIIDDKYKINTMLLRFKP